MVSRGAADCGSQNYPVIYAAIPKDLAWETSVVATRAAAPTVAAALAALARVPARRMRSRTRGLRRRRQKDERSVLPPAMVIRAEPRGGIARGDPTARPPRNASVAASGICYRVLVSPVAPRRASAIVSMPTCGEKPNERTEMRRRARGTPAVASTPSPGRDSVHQEGRRVPVVFSERARCRVNAIQLVRVSARFRAPRRLPQHCRSETRGKKNKQGW